MAGLSSVVGTISTEFKWVAQQNLTGGVYSPIQNSGDIRKNYDCGTAAANSASGGCDQVFSFQQSIAAGSSATIDLNAMTNLLNQTNIALARIKGYQIRLLSATDDPTITPAPNANTTVTITNDGVTLPSPLDFQQGGSGLTLTITNTAGAITNVAIGAAGSGYLKSAAFLAIPVQSGGSGGMIGVITNSTGVPTNVSILAAGTGYADGTVPSVLRGQYKIATGGAHMYFDPVATGFCLVSSTQKNFKAQNNDANNAATIEVDVYAAST